MGVGVVIVGFWLIVVGAAIPLVQFTSVSAFLQFLAWSYLIIYCSIYVCVLLLFTDLRRTKKTTYFYQEILGEDKVQTKKRAHRFRQR